MTAPPMFRAGATALVRAVARPAVAQFSFPDFDDRSSTAEEQAEITAIRLAWVRVVWADPELAEAVSHASPALAAQIEALCVAAAPSGRDVRRVGFSLARYLLRAGHRATPFGLFAGVATAVFGAPTGAVWGKDHEVVARASAEWLSGLVEQLEKTGELLPLLSVVVNDTAFERDGCLIVPYQDDGLHGRRRAVEASVELTSPVRIVVGTAGAPVRFEELVERLSAEFPAVLPERVHGLLAGLIRRRVLITNLQAPATEGNALGYVLAQLDAVGAGSLAPLKRIYCAHQAAGVALSQTDLGKWAGYKNPNSGGNEYRRLEKAHGPILVREGATHVDLNWSHHEVQADSHSAVAA
ncbi:lantibiotic dehydratase [Streptomyces sp. NPDC002676]